MNKPAALFLAGLVLAVALSAHAQEKAPAAAPLPEQIDLQKYHPGQDFTNIDISTLVKVMSEMTRRNFILDERVTGKITVMTLTRISPDEAYQVFLTALEMKGFTAVEDGKVIRIIPLGSARQSGLKVLPDGRMEGEGFVTKLIRLSSVNPQDLVKTLSPLLSVNKSTMKVPLLGDIPLLGWFFKYKTTKAEKTNLMIFITPYIIKNEEDAEEITRRKSDALERFSEEHRVLKKDIGDLIESRKPEAKSAETGQPAPGWARPWSHSLP